MNTGDLRRYAVMGAEARLASLRAEEHAILQQFPELRRGARSKGVSAPSESAAAPVRKRTMSAAMRKAVSDRMRKYWAARRKENAAKS